VAKPAKLFIYAPVRVGISSMPLISMTKIDRSGEIMIMLKPFIAKKIRAPAL